MRKLKTSIVLWLLSGVILMAEGEGWAVDFGKAKETASEKKLPIFALFTGSDWCPWCKMLNSEVLQTDEFKKYAEGGLILFIADFPRNTKVAEETAKQNQDLAAKYGIEGFPTVVIMDAGGKELARTGYRDGGGAKYVEHIKELLGKKEK